MPEKFVSPSPEEDQKARDMMNDAERSLSTDRGFQHSMLKDMGIQGHLRTYRSVDGDRYQDVMEGVLNDHPIKLTRISAEDGSATFTGSLEEVDISSKQAKALWEKYAPASIEHQHEQSKMQYAQKMRNVGYRDEALKELLGDQKEEK